MGRREDKKKETRVRLQTAAFAMFEAQGYDATKVEDIARAAGVSPRTVYRYFPTKAELVYWDTQSNIDRLTSLIAERPTSEPPFAALRAAMIEFAPDIDTRATVDRGRIIAADATLYRYSLEVRDQISHAVGQALVERGGRGATESDLRVLGHMCMTIFLVAVRDWRDAGPDRGHLRDHFARRLDSLPGLVTMPE
jgi:AcrR family transcriptional regulator